MAEVVSTGVSHMCDNSTVSVNPGIIFIQPYKYNGQLILLSICTCSKIILQC